MKKILFVLMFMLLPIGAVAEDFIVTEAQYVVISGNTLDTLGRTMIEPDSIRIVVTDSNGTELFDAWFEAADAQCALNGNVITFFDQWEDINGAASVGVFSIMATIASDADNNIDVYSNQNYTLRGVATTTEATYADIVSILAEIVNIDGWNPITDNDSLIIDQSTIEDMTVATVTTVTGGATSANQTLIIDTVQGIIDTLQLQDGWVAREASLFSGNLNLDNVTGSYDAADFEAASLNGKGDWNINKTGYAITDAEKALIADSVWHANFELHDGTAGSFGDSAQGWGATSAGGTDTLNIKTMMERNFTSASGGDGWANMFADSVWLLDTTGNRIATGFGNILAAINDSMENLATIDEVSEKVWYDIDTVNVDSSKIGEWLVNNLAVAGVSDADAGKIADSVWLANFELHDGTAGSFGDSAQGWGETAAGGTDTLNIKTMMERNFTSASGGDGWANMLADSVWLLDTTGNKLATGFGRILGAVLDTLNLQDGWVAREASLFDGNLNLDNATGTLSDAQIDDIGVSVTANNDKTGYTLTAANINTIAGESADSVWEELMASHTTPLTFGDSLQELIDSVQAILDTLQNQDNWVAREASLFDGALNLNNLTGDFDAADFGAGSLDGKGNWNIGKTGYSLTDVQWENVWFDIDTVNVDSSKIGEWLVNNLAGGGGSGELERALIHVTGAVTGGAPGVTGIGSTTQLAGFVDNYWNNQVVVFVTGNAAGQSTRITDFTDATDSITFEAITTAPAAGDSFIIIAQYDAGGGAASISQADMAEIADSVWGANLEAHDGIAGSFGDSSQAWAATAAGGTDTINIKTMMERNFTSVNGGDGWANMIADSNWGISALTSFGAGSMGDSAIGGINTWGQSGGGGSDTTAIKTMMERNFTSVSGGDGWANMIADSVWLLDTTGNKLATGFGRILGAVLDTLNLQDGWVAREASLFDPANDAVANVTLTATTTNVTNLLTTAVDDIWDADTTTADNATGFGRAVAEGLRPTFVGRRLDITTTGNAGLDWNNITDQAATANLSNTFIGTVLDLADSAINEASIKSNSLTAVKFASNSLNGKGDWNINKTGYSLTTADWNVGKTGYALTVAEHGLISDSVWLHDTTAYTAGGTFGYAATHGAAATISDADKGDIADSVWQTAFNTAFDAGSMGDSLNNSTYVQGAASGLSKEDIADAVLDSMEVGTRQINYRSLTVDSGTVFASKKTGVGFTIIGGATSGDAMNLSATDGDGIDATGGTNGVGFRMTGAGVGSGLDASAAGTGNGMQLAGGTNGSGLVSVGEGIGEGIIAVAGADGNGLQVVGGGTSGDAFALSAAGSGDLIELAARQELASTVADTVWDALVSARSGVTASFGDSAKGWGAVNPAGGYIDSIAGATPSSGEFHMGVYVVDTQGVGGGGDPDTISRVSISTRDASGNTRDVLRTNSDGFTFFKPSSGDWTIVAEKFGYTWFDTTVTVSDDDTLYIHGFNFTTVSNPADADLSRVHGFLRTIQDKRIDGATIIATFSTGTNQSDNTGTAVIVTDASIIASTASDSTGYFFLDLRRTTTYADTSRGFYDIRGYHGDIKLFEVLRLYIPANGNINLGDTLALRK